MQRIHNDSSDYCWENWDRLMDTVVVQPKIVVEPTASQTLLVWFQCHLSDEYLELGK